MILRLLTGIFITFCFQSFNFGQVETYTIKKASFSSDKYDEFSPVFYKNGIVFCTNRNTSLTSYSTSQDKGLFKINYIDTAGKAGWQNSRLLSKYLTTNLNDGPATFNLNGDTIIFSRNLEVSRKLHDISSPRNKLGLFSAALVDGKWTKIRELRFNNEWYNVTTPYLSPDGKKLYFASDKPGGYGGFDIYYSLRKGDYWGDPINLGPVINTKGNEAYPFINPSGELFFSSDGHPGLGGKDIFFSRSSDSIWFSPVRLDPPVNSEFDDFGIVTDSLIAMGYFSSNRDKSIDIFKFRTNFPQIFYTTAQKENHYCFMFTDSGAIEIDTLNLKYVWDFGDGKKSSGPKVMHCYPGSGKYAVKLDLVDRSTGNLFFSKLSFILDLKDYEQPYISSPEIVVKGDPIDFDGLKTNLPGFRILNYSWDFGDGTRLQGERAKHSFENIGKFMVNLGLTLRSDLTGNINKTGVTKKVTVLNSQSEKEEFLAKNNSTRNELPDIRKYDNAFINSINSAESEFNKDVLFQVELLSSKTKIGINSSIFRNVPKEYAIKEIYYQDPATYSYIIDEQPSLMATYTAYKRALNNGFKSAKTITKVLTDPAEKELNTIKNIFGILTDTYFDKNSKLTSTAFLFLDQLARLMNKYPSIRIEIGVHTDNTGSPETKLQLSKTYSQIIANYLINKGIEERRLLTNGFGGTRPVANNISEKGRSLNRRFDFTIIR